MKNVYYSGPPAKCDLCNDPLKDEFVDGVVAKYRNWACMCIGCFQAHGVGLGTGMGQRYKRQADGRFKKIAG